MQHCQTQHTLLFAASILISCDNSDEYFTVTECGMWVATRKRGLAGSAINISLSGFNGCALLGLCVCAAHSNRSKETQRSSEEPGARCCFICSLWSKKTRSFFSFHRALWGSLKWKKKRVFVSVKCTKRKMKNERERLMLCLYVCVLL